jgi:hypothetical protein
LCVDRLLATRHPGRCEMGDLGQATMDRCLPALLNHVVDESHTSNRLAREPLATRAKVGT